MSGVMRVVADFEAPGAAGLFIRELAHGRVAVVVTHRMYSYLRRDCGGDHRAARWLARLVRDIGRPVGVNFEVGDGTSRTYFLAPPSWTEERLKGYVAGLHEELEAELGGISGVWGSVA